MNKAWGPPGTPGGHDQAPLKARAFYDTPGPVAPDKADYNQPHSNPTYAVPGPYASPNQGYWDRPRNPIAFKPLAEINSGFNSVYLNTQFGIGGVVAGTAIRRKGIWETPVFDLMPQLRGSQQSPGDSQPIWIPGAQLAVQLDFRQAFDYLDNLFVYAVEWTAFTSSDDPQDLRPTQFPQDISAYCWDGWGAPTPFNTNEQQAYIPSVTLHFAPPAGVRYWKASLVFDETPYIVANEPGVDPGAPYILSTAKVA